MIPKYPRPTVVLHKGHPVNPNIEANSNQKQKQHYTCRFHMPYQLTLCVCVQKTNTDKHISTISSSTNSNIMPHRVLDFCFYFYRKTHMLKLTGCFFLCNALRLQIMKQEGRGSGKNSGYIYVAAALGPRPNWPNLANMAEKYLQWPKSKFLPSSIH